MRIAICDDTKACRDSIHTLCRDYLQDRNTDDEIVLFASGEQFLSYAGEINLLLLDIEMDGMNGIEVKELLQNNRQDIMIIYITNYKQFMQDAFGRQVYGYLTKPVIKEKLYKLLDQAMREYDENFVVSTEDRQCPFVKAKNIQYIKAEDKYTILVTPEKEFLIRKNMMEWEACLSGRDFCRIHKSYMINLEHVRRVAGSVLMDNGTLIKISRGRAQKFKDQYMDYLRRRVV